MATDTAASFGESFRQARLRVVTPAPARRSAVLAALATFLGTLFGRLANSWAKARTLALSVTGFGFLCAAAWTVNVALGLVAVGVSLLVLEWLGGGDRK
ncbi:MAG TPA: hypothetical protein VM656_09135 [Pyrinomonadaceae bacterium]|nr:hypothetical protein [Pyrinomonadaceae bacterium]